MNEPHVHVMTKCNACSLKRLSSGTNNNEIRTLPVEYGIPEVPATYIFLAELGHEAKNHPEDIATRLKNKSTKHTPFYNPMTSKIIEFTHGSEHND